MLQTKTSREMVRCCAMCGADIHLRDTEDGTQAEGHYYGPLFAHLASVNESEVDAQYWECDECRRRKHCNVNSNERRTNGRA